MEGSSRGLVWTAVSSRAFGTEENEEKSIKIGVLCFNMWKYDFPEYTAGVLNSGGGGDSQ